MGEEIKWVLDVFAWSAQRLAEKAGGLALEEGFSALKQAIAKAVGSTTRVDEVIARLEREPDNKEYREELGRRLVKAKAGQDADIVTAVEALRASLEKESGDRITVSQVAVGTGFAQAGNGGKAKVVINLRGKDSG